MTTDVCVKCQKLGLTLALLAFVTLAHLPCSQYDIWLAILQGNSLTTAAVLQEHSLMVLRATGIATAIRNIPLLVFLLAGCATAQPPVNIRIESDPPGARVFFGVGPNEQSADSGKQYLGVTPCTWSYQPNRDGTFKLPGALVYSIFVPPVAVFTAVPPNDGTNFFTKRQMYHGGTVATPPDKVPAAIFFDLRKPN